MPSLRMVNWREKLITYCDVVLQYDKGKNVYAILRCGNVERKVMWDWKEYEEYIAEMSEEDAVEMRLEDELIVSLNQAPNALC